MKADTRALTEAVDWMIRRLDPGFDDWDALTDWLEADRANAAAYAELAAADDAIAARIAREAASARAPSWPMPAAGTRLARRGLVAGLSVLAAALLGVIGIIQFAPGRSLYPVSTAIGTPRTVALGGGTVLRLNGATLVRLDRNDPRYAEVERGEVVFEVAHDASRPFRVDVGAARLVDLGTRFNVVREPGVTEVGVSEGAVRYEADGETVDLAPGQRLRAVDGSQLLLVSDVDPAAVGSWTRRRLVYDDAPLSQVARDIARNIGIAVEVDPRVANRPVTAVIRVSDDPDELARGLEKLLDIDVERTQDGWLLTESH